MKKTGPKTVKRTVIIVLCAALLIPGGIFLSRKIEQWKKETEIRERYENSGIVIDLPSSTPAQTLARIKLNRDIRQELLDINYVAEAGSCETDLQQFIDFRMDMDPMGLSTFYPTYGYMFRTDNPDQLASHLDIHVREKDGPIGESFFPYSAYGSSYYSARDYLNDHDDVVTTESYHDAADFFEKNYGEAMAGENRSYQSFTMLDEVTVDGVPAYHYEYT